MGLYDSNDIFWTWDGDFATGPDGDLKDTSDDPLLSLRQEIMTVVKSEIGDWELDPSMGATLSDFLGEPNNRENGEAIENRIRTKLVETNLVQREDLSVRVTPTAPHQVMIMINVIVTASTANQLNTSNSVSVNLLYDTMENNLFFFPPVKSEG